MLYDNVDSLCKVFKDMEKRTFNHLICHLKKKLIYLQRSFVIYDY